MRLRANYAKASCEACGGFMWRQGMVCSEAGHGLVEGKAWFAWRQGMVWSKARHGLKVEFY